MKSIYTKEVIAWVRREAKKRGAKSVSHIYPRAYCVAKPAPGCAVFVIPWMDSEPQVRDAEYSSSKSVYEGVEDVKVGDWCAFAYIEKGCSGFNMAFKIPVGGKR